jgi:UDP:flavonoid glycosyltransferase YjiC (YdhE family)
MTHLLVALTAHGYGHLAQTAPVLNALRRRLPSLRLTVYSALPHALLTRRIEGGFRHIARAADVGMCMKDAMEVDVAASAHAYAAFHRDWERAVADEAQLLAEHAPDAVLANAPYRILAAAARREIPALALCSLNWADLYAHFCGGEAGAAEIIARMRAAYGSARAFLQPAPSMPMAELRNGVAIGPIARRGRDRRREILSRLGLPDSTRLILVSLGGVESRLDVTRWPVLPEVCWIVPAGWNAQRDDVTGFESLDMDFVDALRSAGALITKPGYGSFAEAACNGVPVLYAPRPDWPEQPYLEDWLWAHASCGRIGREQLARGDFAAELTALLAAPRRTPVAPQGIAAAVEQLAALLSPPVP